MRLNSPRSTLERPVRRTQLAASTLALFGGALLGLLCAGMPRLATAAAPPSATGTHEAVATDQADATRAALSVLAAGGNAVDGAIAAALALGVVNPSASGIGGGGFALVYTSKDKKVSAFDFREAAPARLDATKLFQRPAPGTRAATRPRGAFDGLNGSVVGVPGEPAGLELLSRRFGRKSLADVAAPAVALAHHGFYAGAHLVKEIVLERARVEASPALGGWFLPGGAAIGLGAKVRRPELAATLVRFGAEGKRALYEGPISERIVQAADRAGAAMTADDLRRYEVKERTPLSRTIDGRTIVTMPAPSAGGLALLEVLSMYGASSRSELAALGLGSSTYIHLVAEALRGAFADRARIAGDPAFEPGVDGRYQAALDPAQLAARRKTIDAKTTHKPTEFRTREQGTSHLIVADADGNVVALTTTVNGIFGASIVADGTGVLLNNELEDFTHPDDAALFALPNGGPNRARGGARPVSSMTPALVLEDGAPILAVGGSGGTRIATGVTEASLARLVFDLEPNACVSAPRFHTQGADLLVDSDVPLDVRWGLSARGEEVKDEVFPTAAVQMVAWKRSPGQPAQLLAASDPRRAGLAAAR